MFRFSLVLFTVFAQLIFSDANETYNDPWENINRKTHNFNMTLDNWVVRPIAETYDDFIPEFVQTGLFERIQE